MPRVSLLVFASLFLAPLAVASASENDASRAACDGKSVGDACTNTEPHKDAGGVTMREVAGACQSAECCEQDYSNGSPPEITCEACVTCKSGATPSSAGDGGGANGEPPRTSDEPPPAANSGRGCQLGGAPSHAGWLALGFVALARRRRSHRC